MRILFRLILFVLLFILAMRFLRVLTAGRKRAEQSEPPKPVPPSAFRDDQIEDATFTDIPDKTKP